MSSACCVVTVPTEDEERQTHDINCSCRDKDFVPKQARTLSQSTDDSSSGSSMERGLLLKAKRSQRLLRQRPRKSVKLELAAKRPKTLPTSSSTSIGGRLGGGAGGGHGSGGYKSCPERQLGGTEGTGNEPLLTNDSDSASDQGRPTKLRKRSWGLIDVGTYFNMRHEDNETSANVNFKVCKTLEGLLRESLSKLEIVNVFWSKDLEGRMLQARFDIRLDKTFERLMTLLHESGIGERTGTSISVMNCLDTKSCVYPHKVRSQGVESAWDRFMDSVRCRLNVTHVVRQVRQDATITFDFLVLLAAAAVLACFGLVENSHLFLSSSMLISPLMGPIIASVFGTVIRDKKLCCLGIKNELFGITCVTFIGLVFGIVVCFMGNFFVISEGLTQEILARCETHSLSVGFFTALASGAAGAIGVLGGNIGSLVGVAISASLLPPAVNSGMLWALAIGTLFFDEDNRMLHNLVKQNIYSTHQSLELIIYASISMGLTLLNIFCVWLMGVIVLRFKEIAPSIRASNEKFWKHDIRIARQSGYDSETQNAIDEFANQNNDDYLIGITEQQQQHTWSPVSRSPEYESICRRRTYHTIHGFEKLCMTLHQNKHKSVSVTENDTGTPSITVMDLFAQGPINISQSTSVDILGVENSHTDGAGAETLALTPRSSIQHIVQGRDHNYRLLQRKRRGNSLLSMLNERKQHHHRKYYEHKSIARVCSLSKKTQSAAFGGAEGTQCGTDESAAQSSSAAQAPTTSIGDVEPQEATLTAVTAARYFGANGGSNGTEWPAIRLKRDDANGAGSSSGECDV